MTKTSKILIAAAIIILTGYIVHMNMKLNDVTSQYESSSTAMAKRFEELNEARIRDREEIAKQKAAVEEAQAAVAAAKLQAAKAAEEAKLEASKATEEKQEAQGIVQRPAIIGNDLRSRAKRDKAEVEEMLKKVSTAPEPWENRESHL